MYHMTVSSIYMLPVDDTVYTCIYSVHELIRTLLVLLCKMYSCICTSAIHVHCTCMFPLIMKECTYIDIQCTVCTYADIRFQKTIMYMYIVRTCV